MSIVAIVGRPNVGKSTLFNRLVGRRQAITDATEGTTRDRHYGSTDWNGRDFTIIDTGGYTVNSDDIFEREIVRQVDMAIAEADVIIFLVDVETGITDLDQKMAAILRRQGKPVVLMVNKVDNNKRQADAFEFYSLGLGEPITVSSMSGSGTGELLDAVVAALPAEEEQEANVELTPQEIYGDDPMEVRAPLLPRFAIVGRPNVGKSSMTNALMGTERNIVTPIAGTTRDSIDSHYNKFGKEFILVDTAGVRKKTKVHEDLEFYAVLRAIRAIEGSDVTILMIDATVGVDAQDMNIFQLIVKNKKGCVVVINKWDAVKDKLTNSARDYAAEVRSKLAPFNDVPIIFTSALEKQRIMDVIDQAMHVYENRRRRISTSELNEFLLPIIENTPPPSTKGKYIKIKYVTQLPTVTPSFALFVNLPQYIRDSYRRFLENKIRDRYDFTGCPIQIY
ncbi:MAG: ribosome biogenesis GTPase Der, partial [Mucinivorans sp.]